jgi:hypothetical protein
MRKKSVRKVKPAASWLVDSNKPISDEFSEPIVIPFKGMFSDPAGDSESIEHFLSDPTGDRSLAAPSAQDLIRDGTARQIEKLPPEFLALLISSGRKNGKSEEEICEAFVESADPKMKQRMHQKEKSRRTATLVRRLSEGRKRLGKQRPMTGKKTRI